MRTHQRQTARPVQEHARSQTSSPALGILGLQRLVGNQATLQLLQRHASPPAPPASNVIQRAWGTETYSVSGTDRTMHVDQRQVTWGATGSAGQHTNHRDDNARPRAIMFESMSVERGMVGLTTRLRDLNKPWDVGLTLVLNRSWTPPKQYTKGTFAATTKNSTDGVTAQQAKTELDRVYTQVTNNWNGPPLQMVTAAWERRQLRDGDTPEMEVVQASVPYTTLRRISATNPGAGTIEGALRSNHKEFWRKMGDDDMPIVDPNGGGAEMQKLGEVEGSEYTNVMVTFGYNLTTEGTVEPITGYLEAMYRKEMQLRDAIHGLGAPIYPSEPTTFYRPIERGGMDAPWRLAERQDVGGSGQQLEGAKLARATREGSGLQQFAFHTVQVNTGGARRNDGVIRVLNQWWNNGNGDPEAINEADLEAEINKLDQSAMRHNEYMAKVVKNLGIPLKDNVFSMVEGLVLKYRKDAVHEIALAMSTRLRFSQRSRRYAVK